VSTRKKNSFIHEGGKDYVSMYHYEQACNATNIYDEEFHLHASLNRGCAKELTKETFQRKDRNKIFTSQHMGLVNNEEESTGSILTEIEPLLKIPNIVPPEMDQCFNFSVLVHDLLPHLTIHQKYILAFVIYYHNLYEYIDDYLGTMLKDFAPYINEIVKFNVKNKGLLFDYFGEIGHKISGDKLAQSWSELKDKLEELGIKSKI
jgi:hypothetical protein